MDLFADNLVALSIVIDVDRTVVKEARRQLAIAINNLDAQDLVFVYREDQEKTNKPGYATGIISDYKSNPNIDYRIAMCNSAIVLLREDYEYPKMIFFVFDRFTSKSAYGVNCGLEIENCDNINVFLCGVGDNYDKQKVDSLHKCTSIHFENFNQVGEFIKEKIKEAHGEKL